MQDAGYIFAVYTIIWLALLAFVVGMINRQAKLGREIQRLKGLVKDKEKSRQSE
jgi:CcmD family protein